MSGIVPVELSAAVIAAADVEAHTPEVALYGFAAFYVLCLAVNWWCYARKGAEVRC